MGQTWLGRGKWEWGSGHSETRWGGREERGIAGVGGGEGCLAGAPVVISAAPWDGLPSLFYPWAVSSPFLIKIWYNSHTVSSPFLKCTIQ